MSPDEAEHSFWNTPAAAARTLHFTDDSLLTDEHMDLSAPSLASPLTDAERNRSVRGKLPPRATARQLVFEPAEKENWKAAVSQAVITSDETVEHIDLDSSQVLTTSSGPDEEEDEEDTDADEDDNTVMLRRPAADIDPQPMTEANEVTFELPSPPPAPSTKRAETKKPKFKITEEMEAIIVCSSLVLLSGGSLIAVQTVQDMHF